MPQPPNGFKARPTTDFAKENLFNILENFFDLATVDVLDLFAGTGGISCEFASRGSLSVDAVEIENIHFNYIKKTVKLLELNQIHVIRNDVFRFLEFCKKKYDIIFADPPYSSDRIRHIPLSVAENRLLKPDGLLAVEHPSTVDFEKTVGFFKRKSYGSVNFSFFRF